MSNVLPQHRIPFYDDQLLAVQQRDGTICVLFARLCDNLGLSRESQVRRIARHEVLQEGLVVLEVQTDGGPQMVQCLKLSLLPLWLSSLQASRVKAELRDKLVRYQHDAADVLWQAFKPQILGTPDVPAASNTDLAQLEQIAAMGRAITHMAEEQIEMRRRMDAAVRAFQDMRRDITAMHLRLGVLEDRTSPVATISDAQAAEVSTRVKALAKRMTIHDASKNHYQGIFSELYRRFSVSSYKRIAGAQYESVLAFLDSWRAAVECTDPMDQENTTTAP